MPLLISCHLFSKGGFTLLPFQITVMSLNYSFRATNAGSSSALLHAKFPYRHLKLV